MHFFLPPWLHHGRPSKPVPIFSVDLQPHGDRLATAGQDGTIKIWHVPLIAQFATKPSPNMALSPPTADKPPPGALLATISSHSGAVNTVRWSPHSKLLASGGDDAVVLVYHREHAPSTFSKASENWVVRKPLRGHTGDVTGVCWSPDSEILASASVDNSIFIWSMRHNRMMHVLEGHKGLVKGVAWDPVGRYLASQSDDRTVRIWRTSDWKVEQIIEKPFRDAIYKENSMAFFLRISWSPCGTQLLATNAFKVPNSHIAPMFSRASAFDEQIEFIGHREPVISTRFSPRLYRPHPERTGSDGKPIANGNDDSTKSIYTCLALGSKDCGATIWQATATRPFFNITQMFGMDVIDLSWGTDGYTLVACSPDGSVLYMRFDPPELGQVVSLEETRSILADQWRQLGSAGGDSKPIAESAQQLQMEARASEKPTADPVENKVIKKVVPKPVTPSIKSNGNHYKPLKTVVEETIEIEPSEPPPKPVPIKDPVSKAPPSQANHIKPSDDMSLAEADESIVPGTPPRSDPSTSVKPTEASTNNLPPEVAAAAERVRKNGPTPPADPKIIAAQNETRVRGGKRRITPMAVSSVPVSNPAPSASRLQPTPASTAKMHMAEGMPMAPASKRPRMDGPNGTSVPLPQKTNNVQTANATPATAGQANGSVHVDPHVARAIPPGSKPVSHAAHLYAPSILGLSMMLLPEKKGSGPRRVRVISKEVPPTIVESRECDGSGGGYSVECSCSGKTLWKDYYTKSAAVTALAGIAGKFVAIGTADATLFLYSAKSGRRITPPISVDSAPYMLEALCVKPERIDEKMDVSSEDDELWFVVFISRSALCSVFEVRQKRLICSRSAVSLLARPVDTESEGSAEKPRKAAFFREIAECRVTQYGEPILILSDSQVYVFSKNFGSWLRVADDLAPNSEYMRTVPPTKKVGLLRMLQGGAGVKPKGFPSLTGMGDLRRSAVESLSHLESLMESAIALGSAVDYRYYLTNYAARIAAAVSDDLENCTVRLRELCDYFLNSKQPSTDLTILGMSCRGLLKQTVLPVVSANRRMQRFVAEYNESLTLVERMAQP